MGFVDDDARVRGARVEVTTLAGRGLLARGERARTTAHGTFDVRLRRALPATFVVTLRGGRVGGRPLGGALRAIVRRSGGAAELVHVSPVSSIVAARYLQRPRRGLAAAQRDVRRLLGLPRGHDLDDALRRDDRLFDAARFLPYARAHGGVERAIERLGAHAARGRVTFHERPAARASATAPPTAGGIGTRLVEGVVDGLVGKAKSTALAWILGGLGFGSPNDAAKLDQILAQLDDLARSMRQLERDVARLQQDVRELRAALTRGQYAQLVASFGPSWVGGRTDTILADLVWLAEHAAGECGPAGRLDGCVGSVPAGADPAGWCASPAPKNQFSAVACDAIAQIAAKSVENTLAKAIDGISGTAGADGLIAAYLRSKTATLAAANAFATGDYRAEAERIYDHYTTIEALLATYLVQFWVAQGHPTDLILRKLATTQEAIAGQAELLPAPLPGATVLHVEQRRMWALARAPRRAAGQPGAGECLQPGAAWLWFWQLQSPSPACAELMRDALTRTGGLDGWRVAGSADLATLPARLTQSLLTGAMRLPDISAEAAAVRIPPPDPLQFPSNVRWSAATLHDNPGTAFGVMTADCQSGVTWNSGLTASGGNWQSPVFARGRFCTYVELDGGTARRMCAWGDPGYYGCSMPVSRTAQNRYGFGSGPLDYGHPNAVLLWRPADGEPWVLR
jgi:outer membrane murein-binding lipoprotein Lpp